MVLGQRRSTPFFLWGLSGSFVLELSFVLLYLFALVRSSCGGMGFPCSYSFAGGTDDLLGLLPNLLRVRWIARFFASGLPVFDICHWDGPLYIAYSDEDG